MPPLINLPSTQASISLLQYAERQPWLLFLSAFMAVLASAMALQVSEHARKSQRAATRRVSITTGAAALAAGVWAMHFISLQAINWPFPVKYDWRLTALSLLPALLPAWSTLRLLAQAQAKLRDVIQCGALMTLGIGTMQLVGLSALQLPMQLQYVISALAEGAVINLVLLSAALGFRFAMRHRSVVLTIHPLARIWSSGLVLGLAIVFMQMLPLAGIHIPADTPPSPNTPDWGMRDAIGTGIALVTAVLLLVVVIGNDLLRAQELLSLTNASEARWRSTLNTLTDAVILFDERGLVQTMNPAGMRLFGWSAEEVHDMRLPDLLRDVASIGLMQLARREAMPPSWETIAYRKSREPIPVLMSVGEVALPGTRWFVAQVSDISVRKAMEHALHDSEARMRNLMRNTPGMAFSIRLPDRSATYISEGAKPLTGWSATEFIERNLKLIDMVHPEDREAYRQQVRAALHDQVRVEAEFRLIHRQGHTVWIMARANVVRNAEGQVQSMDGLLLDITEQKSAELTLRSQESQMRALLAHIPAVVLRSSATAPYAVHFVSDNIRAMTGWPAHAFVQGFIKLEHLCRSDEVAHANALRAEAIQNRESYDAELRLRHRDGHEVWVQMRGRAEYDEHQRPLWLDCVLLDITHTKRLEPTYELFGVTRQRACAQDP